MSNVEAFVLGLLVAWTPSLIVAAVLLWRAPVIEDGRPERRIKAALRSAPCGPTR